ncbi:MAG: hypothetical protein LBL66_04910 [Clostridiales bacterium]|jgi:hypothetical protein|nr:hypothetical protein [Clostridiales bacterium]
MANVKKECFDRLAEFGFLDEGGEAYVLDPNFYKDGHPLKGLFTAVNVFIEKSDGRFWCGFANDEAHKAFNAIKQAGMLE